MMFCSGVDLGRSSVAGCPTPAKDVGEGLKSERAAEAHHLPTAVEKIVEDLYSFARSTRTPCWLGRPAELVASP